MIWIPSAGGSIPAQDGTILTIPPNAPRVSPIPIDDMPIHYDCNVGDWVYGGRDGEKDIYYICASKQIIRKRFTQVVVWHVPSNTLAVGGDYHANTEIISINTTSLDDLTEDQWTLPDNMAHISYTPSFSRRFQSGGGLDGSLWFWRMTWESNYSKYSTGNLSPESSDIEFPPPGLDPSQADNQGYVMLLYPGEQIDTGWTWRDLAVTLFGTPNLLPQMMGSVLGTLAALQNPAPPLTAMSLPEIVSLLMGVSGTAAAAGGRLKNSDEESSFSGFF